MKQAYTQEELSRIVSGTIPRNGWDFSRMRVTRQAVPWEYEDEVRRYLKLTDRVLDIGTGGGEAFGALSDAFADGLGVDLDPVMIETAKQRCMALNLDFAVSSERLENIKGTFDVIVNRHAPFDLKAIVGHLAASGYFVTQQVGERNMDDVKTRLGQSSDVPPVQRDEFDRSGLKLVAFMEYDVEYIVHDIESLVFWLGALDFLHADIAGSVALENVDTLNLVLAGSVGDDGFHTNEHRYLAIAEIPRDRLDGELIGNEPDIHLNTATLAGVGVRRHES